ncbi:hypothetical protein LTR53_010690, partial [Teratosphaeriaceae sp. CCFEE 6253]
MASSSSSSPRVAWIGLGNMGRGMVANIVSKGTYAPPLLIYNRTAARAEKLAASLPEGKTTVVTSIAEAVKDADIIFTWLYIGDPILHRPGVGDDKAIQETLTAALEDPALAKDKLFVDCSTIHPDTTNALAAQVTAAG